MQEDHSIEWKRQNFIKKMYSVLSMQLITTTASILPVVMAPSVKVLLPKLEVFIPITIVGGLLALCKVFFEENKENKGKLYGWLGVSTLLNGCSLALYKASEWSNLRGIRLLSDLGMIASIMTVVTFYTWTGKKFSPFEALCFALLAIILIGIIGWYLGFAEMMLDNVECCCWSMFWCGIFFCSTNSITRTFEEDGQLDNYYMGIIEYILRVVEFCVVVVWHFFLGMKDFKEEEDKKK